MENYIEISPNMVRQHVSKFALGGAIPSDVQSDLDMLKQNLSKAANETQRSSIQRAIDSIESKYAATEIPSLFDEVVVEESNLDFDPSMGLEMLCNGEFFKKFPEKLIGTVKLDDSRHGQPIQVLIGDISDLSKIEVNDNFDQFIKDKQIGVSSSAPTITESIAKPENEQFIKDIIEKSKVSIGNKAVSKVKKKEFLADETLNSSMDNVQTARQIFHKLNPNISKSEIQAYVWYKEHIGQRLAQEWYDLSEYDTKNESLEDWVKSNILCYIDGQLLPQVLYLSGDIYWKVKRLVKASDDTGQDAEYIIKTYGEEVLKNQMELINNKYAELYSKRLIITGNDDGNSLIIKPISKLAKAFKVSELNEYEKLEWWERKGEIDIEKEDGNSWKKTTFDELTLQQAFCFYLLTQRQKLDIRGNITYRDIIYFYIQKRTKQAPSHLDENEVKKFKAQLERTKAKASSEGNRLFLKFLAEQLTINDKVRLETTWNSKYNNYVAPDYSKIPVAFNVAKEFYGEKPFEIKPEKREAVAFIFNEGSGCLAYDVGVGKTMSAIMAAEQFLIAGYSKRPVMVVPNQTFKQWVSEVRAILPHRKINALFNLGVDYIEEVMDENNNPMAVEEGSISIITYEGFKAIGFNEQTEQELLGDLYEILNQGGADDLIMESTKKADTKKASFRQKLEGLIGRSLKGTVIPIETLKFDYICFDEAHALKKVFTSVKGETDEVSGKRDKRKQYSIQSGLPSDTALKGFMLAQYILRNNNYRNVVMLTATPFTNSPLEVFSMLSMLAYHQLVSLGINNINDFFDTFIDADTDLVINHKLKPEYKQVVKGFNNLPSLQRIILRFFNYKDGTDIAGLIRPNKIVLPYSKKLVDGSIISVDESEKVGCYIPMNQVQKEYMAEIIAYAEGQNVAIFEEESDENIDEDEDALKDSQSVEIDESSLGEKEKSGVRAIKAMTHSRNLALSPYVYKLNRLGKPTYKKYIETSPKLLYVVKCIETVKKYHESKNEPVSGQVIYMDRGIQFFDLIKEYLVKEIGFEDHEVGMIYSKGMSVDKKRQVQDAFLGRVYNEAKQDYENLPDAKRLKVLIGSSSIREGMNLQKKSTVLYNCFVDWNPTDMQQLAGRIWRQGNEFENVRIVNPLMIDSIDIFMFQKLEEKTSRINTIWSNDGRSVLKLEEVNPNEIKYALIKDPKIIAQIEIDEKAVKLEDEKRTNNSLKDRLDTFVQAVKQNENYVKSYFNDLVEKYTNLKSTDSNDLKYRTLLKLYSTDQPLDKDGAVMVSSWERTNSQQRSELIEKFGKISMLDKPYKPYWFDYYTTNARLIAKEMKDLINPRNINPEFADDYIRKLDFDNEQLDKDLAFLKSADYVEKRVAEIVKYREDNKIVEKQIPQLVNEFERMNYLLSLKRIEQPKETLESFKRLNPDGTRKTDPDSLKKLEQLVLSLPQTKALNTDVNGEYTEERKKLHEEIIKEVKKGTACVEQQAPIAILTGGSPASGKTTFLKTFAPYLLKEDIFHVDADEIRAMLPEYEDGGWNASATHLETKDIVNRLLTGDEITKPCKHDLIYDGTMNSSKNYLPLIGLLKQLGYKIFIIYMDNVPYSVVKQRMVERYKNHGRFVPVEVIDDFFGKGKEALYELRNKVDGYMIIDANDKNYKIIEQGGIELPKERSYSEMQTQTISNSEKESENNKVFSNVKIKGVTNIYTEDGGKTLIFGTKNNQTRVSVVAMSKEDIIAEIKFEKGILERSKKQESEFDANEIKNSFTLTLKEKEDILKMHRQSLLTNQELEELIIPFYESHLDSNQVSENEEILQAIAGLEIMLEFSTKAEIKQINQAISGLKLMLE